MSPSPKAPNNIPGSWSPLFIMNVIGITSVLPSGFLSLKAFSTSTNSSVVVGTSNPNSSSHFLFIKGISPTACIASFPVPNSSIQGNEYICPSGAAIIFLYSGFSFNILLKLGIYSSIKSSTAIITPCLE